LVSTRVIAGVATTFVLAIKGLSYVPRFKKNKEVIYTLGKEGVKKDVDMSVIRTHAPEGIA
jgi:hypothetical protein